MAPVIAPLIGGQLLLFTTWRVIFVILAIFSAILLAGSLLFRESLPKEKRVTGGVATATKNYITLIKDKRFLGQTLIQFFAFGGFFAYISGSSFVYQNIFQLSAQEFSYLFGINSCGIILASAISARLSNVITVRQLLTFALWQLTIGSLLFLIAMLFEWPLIPVTAILFFTVCTVSLFGSASFSMAMAKYGKMAGSASAVLGFASMFLCRNRISISWYWWGIYRDSHGDYNASMFSAFLIVPIWFGRKRLISFTHLYKPHNGARLQQNNISI